MNYGVCLCVCVAVVVAAAAIQIIYVSTLLFYTNLPPSLPPLQDVAEKKYDQRTTKYCRCFNTFECAIYVNWTF